MAWPKGKPRSDETRRKIAEAHLGVKIGPTKARGKTKSPEHRSAISAALKGKPKNYEPWNKGRAGVYSTETIAAMKDARARQVTTEETRAKMRASHLGRPTWNKGKPGCFKMTAKTRQHQSERQRGEKSHRWRGGKTKLAVLIRTSARYAMWREEVFLRDGFRCRWCGAKPVWVEAHHRRPFADLLAEAMATGTDPLEYEPLWDSANGLTLCRPCHDTTKSRPRGASLAENPSEIGENPDRATPSQAAPDGASQA